MHYYALKLSFGRTEMLRMKFSLNLYFFSVWKKPKCAILATKLPWAVAQTWAHWQGTLSGLNYSGLCF